MDNGALRPFLRPSMSAKSAPKSAGIVPFWDRLPSILLYPANGAAMSTIVVLALGRLMYLLPVFGAFAVLALFAAMYRYCFECLRSSADGYLKPPDVSASASGSIGWKFLGLMAILIIITLAVFLKMGAGPGWILVLFLVISLPGAAMTLAMEESLTEALNPLKWLAIMMGVGWPYLAVVGLCLVISASEGYAGQAAEHLLPKPVAVVAIGIISNYALVVTFHLMGYLVFQYHDRLGFDPESIQVAEATAPSNPAAASLDEVGALVREGKLEEATERTRALLQANGAVPAVNAQYRKLLRAANNTEGLLAHGREYLPKLIEGNEDRAAVDLLRECQALDPAFAPTSAMQVTKLAYMASRQNQPQAALLLVRNFEERFPKSQYIAQSCLLAAEVLHEHMSRDEEACALLRHLKETVPGDPLMPEIDSKLAAIEKMIAATKKPQRTPT